MPKKPGRSGIKFRLLADSASHYCYNIIPYLSIEGDKVATVEILPATDTFSVSLCLKSCFKAD